MPVGVPKQYQKALRARVQALKGLQQQMQEAIIELDGNPNNPNNPNASQNQKEEGGGGQSPSPSDGAQSAVTASVAAKFLEWVHATGKSQQLLDLVRIDGAAKGVAPSSESNSSGM